MNFSIEAIARRLQLGEDSGWELKQIEFSRQPPGQLDPRCSGG